MGYHRAGFDVVGVDIAPQPNYPFEFIQADALDYFKRLIDAPLTMGTPSWGCAPIEDCWDAIHASPPCQRYIRGGLQDREKHPDLLGPTRDLLEAAGLPYVIENVPGAPMRADLVLCGSMFSLPLRRHRWFESNAPLPALTLCCDHSRPVVGVYGHPHGEAGAWKGMLPGSFETWSEAMGIDWMTTAELADAIPPSYTELIGAQLLQHLRAQEAA